LIYDARDYIEKTKNVAKKKLSSKSFNDHKDKAIIELLSKGNVVSTIKGM
jgi:hypothetical protein